MKKLPPGPLQKLLIKQDPVKEMSLPGPAGLIGFVSFVANGSHFFALFCHGRSTWIFVPGFFAL